jgi:ferrochelatase
VCSAGFVSDHLEILYDLDIEAEELAREAGIRLERTEMPNDDPTFLRAVAAAIRDHVDEEDRS